MVAGTLIAGSLLTLVEGATYVFVGARLRRTRWTDAPLAWKLFATWWMLIGLNKALAGIAGFSFAAGLLNVPGYLTVIHVNLLLLTTSLFCLFAYLLFLFSGRERPVLIGIVYAIFWFTLEWSLQIAHPVGVGIAPWRTYLANANSAVTPLSLFNLGMLFLPQVVAAALYLGLLRRVTDKTQRYRIPLVSLSIIAWSLSITLIAFPGFSDSGAMQIGSHVVGLLAGAATLLAYTPPLWIRRRLDVETVARIGLSTARATREP